MVYTASFFSYLALLLLYSLYTGLNHCRIQYKAKINPQIVTFLLPFLINFVVAKMVFNKINPLFSTLMPCIMIFAVGLKAKKIRIFGLTGNIGCGKSTLVGMIQQNLGSEVAIIDCDKINSNLRLKGHAGYNLILSLLKENGQDPDNYINNYNQQIKREVLSKFTFEHPQFLKRLAAKLGTFILWQIFKQVVSYASSKKKMILIDAPTLYETKVLTYFCFPIIVVGCSQATQVKRLMNNRKMTEDEAKLRIGSQMPLSIKMRLADIYVQNQSTPDEMFVRTIKNLNRILDIRKK